MHTNLFTILCFSCQGKSRDIVYQRICLFLWLIFAQHGLFWNSTHCLLSPFTLDWSRNLWHNLMWDMVVNNISYPIYPLSTRTEKGYITKMIPFFFCSVYISFSLYAPISLDECHAWFHLQAAGQGVRSTEQATIIKWKQILSIVGFEPTPGRVSILLVHHHNQIPRSRLYCYEWGNWMPVNM